LAVMLSRRPVAVTMGEPAGIGPEITVAAWKHLAEYAGPPFVLLGDMATLCTAGGIAVRKVRTVLSPDEAVSVFNEALPVMPVPLCVPVKPGSPDPLNAPAVTDSIRLAVKLAVSEEVSAVVTNPIQKSTLYRNGFAFPGHTEFLEHLAGPPHRSVMMLATPGLRVVPVTIHQSLRSAVADLSTERIIAVAKAAVGGLRRDFGIVAPRVAVAGLNPHAGEDGTMGHEDSEIVAPAVAALREEGVDAIGPLPPDTMFTPRRRASYDLAICMYHDQALIPLKTLEPDNGVNVTLGLPFVRTSPDHGTALDIAGRGLADAGSLIAAIKMASHIAAQRKGV